MENPTLELIHQHASVRHYKPDPVPAALVETIVAAAQRASSSSNLQSYSVVAVIEAAKRERLAELCGNQDHIRQAPVMLVWCADLARLRRVCELRHHALVSDTFENFLVAAVDAAIAAQTAALAAESLGLGICYIGSIRNCPDEVIGLLELPQLVFPITGMTVGYPATEPSRLPRLPLEAVLHWEKYDASCQDAGLQKYDTDMLVTGIYQDRKVQVPGKAEELEPYSWLESAARRAARRERIGLRASIMKQGFSLE